MTSHTPSTEQDAGTIVAEAAAQRTPLSLTGEHGVGIAKRDLMTVQFAPEDLYQQMRVRAVFDPAWLLNPAKVFPLEGRLAA